MCAWNKTGHAGKIKTPVTPCSVILRHGDAEWYLSVCFLDKHPRMLGEFKNNRATVLNSRKLDVL
jgi:hypothetical protein